MHEADFRPRASSAETEQMQKRLRLAEAALSASKAKEQSLKEVG